jgi:tetratricopeptide (TPR) repeat protein
MKRLALLLALAALAAAAWAVVQRLERDRQYYRLLTAGDEALAAGRPFDAVEAYSGALALRPRSIVAYYRRGEAYQQQRRTDAAVRDYREASRLAPDATPPLVALGRLYDAQGQPEQAAEWYARASDRIRGEDPGLLYALALARYRAGVPATAREPLERAVARADAPAEAYYLLGLVCRDMHDLDCARTALEQAVRLASLGVQPAERRTFVAAREELADLYRVTGRPFDEIAQLKALAARDAQGARVVAVALAEARQGQIDAALATLAGRPAAAGDDTAALLGRARILLARAERTRDRQSAADALRALDRALAGTARRGEALPLYGRALFLSGDTVGALRVLREAVTTRPLASDAFDYLAEAAERTSPLEARDALLSLDALEGDTASGARRAGRARRVGLLSFRVGDHAQAARHLQHAADGGLDAPDVTVPLVESYWEIGDEPKARETLERALARAPRHPGLVRLSRTILR